MKIVDLAQEMMSELGDPDSVSIPSISYWFRSNIGLLDTKINKKYTLVDNTYEITPDLGETEKTIYKALYNIHYIDRQLKATLGAASTDAVLEVSDGVGLVRKINKNELSKTWLQAKKDALEDLDKLIKAYKSNAAVPLQVAGDDTYQGYYPNERYSDVRTYNRTD